MGVYHSPTPRVLWQQCIRVQVALSTSDGCRVSTGDGFGERERLVIRTPLAVLCWCGNVSVARLGTHSSRVFVSVSDIGRRVLIEARDFEGGPVLASSTVSLEVWTGDHMQQGESRGQ